MAKKRKSSSIEVRDWMKTLRTSEPERIYVFYGEELYRLEQSVNMIRDRAVPKELQDLNVTTIEGARCSRDELWEVCATMPVMCDRRVVIVSDYPLFKDEGIEEMLDSLGEEICLIFTFSKPDFSPDRRTKAYKAVEKRAKLVNFERATPGELKSYIKSLFLRRRHTISDGDALYMISVCGNDTQTLFVEAAKISAYAKETNIRRSDIDAVGTRALESKVFDLTSDITSGSIVSALERLHDLELLAESPIMVNALIGRQFRQVYMCKCARNEGYEGSLMLDLGLRYVFHLEPLMEAAERYTLDELRTLLIECEKNDLELKSGGDYDILCMFIAKAAGGKQ